MAGQNERCDSSSRSRNKCVCCLSNSEVTEEMRQRRCMGDLPPMEKYGRFSLYQLPPYNSHLLNRWVKEVSFLTVDFPELLWDNNACLSFLAMASDKADSPCLYAYSSNDKKRDYSTPSLGSENFLSQTDCLALLKTGVSLQGDEAGMNKSRVTEIYWMYKSVTA